MNTSPGGAPSPKSAALKIILDAWESALASGVLPEELASVAMFAALTDMVDLHGAEAVAVFAEGLPARIRAGEFTLEPSK
jgi:hypothetical protein